MRRVPAHRGPRARPACALLVAAFVVPSACHGPPSVGALPGGGAPAAIADVGFDEPENVVYDSTADVFLVSNIVGDPAARDGRAFISRVGPFGRMLTLHWITSGVDGAALDAPKGLALHGDTLAVADLGAVRFFDRRTGKPLGTLALPGLVMNDLAFARDGTLWITDTGPERGATPVDTSRDLDAVWRVDRRGRVAAAARGLSLDRPDGIAFDGRGGALVATFGARRLMRVGIGEPAEWTLVATLPAGRLDGLRRLPDGAFALTSWDARAVWRLEPGSAPSVLASGIRSPAGVAVDTRRHRLAVTSMLGNALYLVPLPRPAAAVSSTGGMTR